MTEREAARLALLDAVEQLISGDQVGPLTGMRLCEVAGVKRHRLTHDNPDIYRDFMRRVGDSPNAKELRSTVRPSQSKEIAALRSEIQLLSTVLYALAEERDRLKAEIARMSAVVPLLPRSTPRD